MATNKGLDKDEEWEWLCRQDVDIENFHIKTASFYQNKLIIFARGQPRNVYEQCCSFLLIFHTSEESGKLKIDPNYNYIKLDPIVYA